MSAVAVETVMDEELRLCAAPIAATSYTASSGGTVMDEELRRNTVIEQRVDAAKHARAKEMRHAPTAAERKLWVALRRNQLDGVHFRRQQVIDGFIADFYCHAAGLIVEVDGPIHHEQQAVDAERDLILGQRGLRVLRVSNRAVMNDLSAMLERIRRHARKTLTD